MNITDEQIERFVVAHERIGHGLINLNRTMQGVDQEEGTLVGAVGAVASALHRLGTGNACTDGKGAVELLSMSLTDAAETIANGLQEVALQIGEASIAATNKVSQ